MKEKKLGNALFKTSAIVATALAGYYIVTLDNIDNVWQYAICLVSIVYLLFVLCIKWDVIVRKYDDEDVEIVNIDDYK